MFTQARSAAYIGCNGSIASGTSTAGRIPAFRQCRPRPASAPARCPASRAARPRILRQPAGHQHEAGRTSACASSTARRLSSRASCERRIGREHAAAAIAREIEAGVAHRATARRGRRRRPDRATGLWRGCRDAHRHRQSRRDRPACGLSPFDRQPAVIGRKIAHQPSMPRMESHVFIRRVASSGLASRPALSATITPLLGGLLFGEPIAMRLILGVVSSFVDLSWSRVERGTFPGCGILDCPGTRELQADGTWSPAQVHVVIAAYNEAAVIARVVVEVKRAGYPVVVVDDGSRDATAAAARAAGATVVEHPFNLGQGAALQTGIDYALGEGGRGHRHLRCRRPAPGRRHRPPGGGAGRRARRLRARQPLSRTGAESSSAAPPAAQRRNPVHALTTGLRLTDTHNGLRAMSRSGAAAIRLRQNRMAHASEFLARSAQRASLCRTAGDHRIHRLFARQGPENAGDAVLILLDLFARRLYR